MKKKEKYKRDRTLLLNDLYKLLTVKDISESLKFNHLRNDFLHAWTSPDATRKKEREYWSEKALELYQSRYELGIKNERELFKGIQLDHVVPRVWFEEMIMPLIIHNQLDEIPKHALKYLFETLAIGAFVTKNENQREIDSILQPEKNKKGEEVWKKRPHKFGMPINFYNKEHDYFLNAWARYMEGDIKVKKVKWINEKMEVYDLEFDHYKFEFSRLTAFQQEGYNYWAGFIENVYCSIKNETMTDNNASQ